MGFMSNFVEVGYKYGDFSNKTYEVGIPRTSSSTIQDATQTLSRIPKAE